MIFNTINVMAALSTLAQSRVTNKTVLVRIDSDVDIENGKILDDTRLLSCLETVRHLLHRRCPINLVGHLGRPEGPDKSFSLEPIAKWFARVFAAPLKPLDSPFGGWKIGAHLALFENIRFFVEEEQNDSDFAKHISETADIFVNEAFAVAHRAHATTVGICTFLPSYAGIHFAREIDELNSVLQHPKRPLAVIIGGAKIETKLPMVEKMHKVADFVLVGGEVADHVKELITVQHSTAADNRSIVLVADLTTDGLDITRKSAENFIQVLRSAKTIVWNGPVGQTGKDPVNEQGTRLLAYAIAHSHAYSIVGGGDTLSYLRQHKLLDKFNFVSVGGGAMLEYLAGKKLPAVVALQKSTE